MKSLKCLLTVIAVAGIWVSTASADLVQTWNSSDQNFQGRTGQYGGGNQLTTTQPGLNTSFMTIGQKGTSATATGTTTVNSTLPVVLNQKDAFGRHVLRWNMAGLPEPGGDGTMRLIFTNNPPGGYTLSNNGVSLQLYEISQANGDWADNKAKWQAKDITTNTLWVGSGGVGALGPGDLAYGDGSYALGAPGGGGYAASPFASITFDGSSIFTAGTAYYLTIPYATLEAWWQADNGVSGLLNAGMLLRLDATSEAENGTYGAAIIKQVEFAASDATYTDSLIGAWGNNGRPMLQYESIPEPAAMSLLALGGLAILRRRR